MAQAGGPADAAQRTDTVAAATRLARCPLGAAGALVPRQGCCPPAGDPLRMPRGTTGGGAAPARPPHTKQRGPPSAPPPTQSPGEAHWRSVGVKLEACVGLNIPATPGAAGASCSLVFKQAGQQLACLWGGSRCVDLIWLHIIVLWHAHAVVTATACPLVSLLCSLAGCAQQPTSVWQQHGVSWTGHRLCVTALVCCRTLNALLLLQRKCAT